MGDIYKITNKITGGIYIGKTIYSTEKRWKNHVLEALNHIEQHQYILNYAIRKYGVDNFLVETIESNLYDDELLLQEQYWIKYYNSYYKNNPLGYNMTLGGDGNVKYSTDDILQLWSLGLSQTEIAKQLDCNVNTVSERLKGHITKEEALNRAVTARQKKIFQYDLTGNLLNSFESICDAERETGVCNTNISLVINKKRKTAGGFLWSVTNDEIEIKNLVEENKNKFHRPHYNSVGVIKCDLNGNPLQEYSTVNEAARNNHISSSSNIISCCKGDRKTCGGFTWKYAVQ